MMSNRFDGDNLLDMGCASLAILLLAVASIATCAPAAAGQVAETYKGRASDGALVAFTVGAAGHRVTSYELLRVHGRETTGRPCNFIGHGKQGVWSGVAITHRTFAYALGRALAFAGTLRRGGRMIGTFSFSAPAAGQTPACRTGAVRWTTRRDATRGAVGSVGGSRGATAHVSRGIGIMTPRHASRLSASAATISQVGSGLWLPWGVAVDAGGDIFIADSNNARVVEEIPDGAGGYTQTVPIDSGLNFPEAVVVDRSGDLFIADYGLNEVLRETPNGSGYTQSVVDVPMLNHPYGLAVDPSGDLFIADTYNSRVLEEVPNGVGGYNQTVVGSGWDYPNGVAVTSSGDLWVAEPAYGGIIEEVPNGSGGWTRATTLGAVDATRIAVDGSGDLYVAENDANAVVKETPAQGGGYTSSVVDDVGLNTPDDVAVDSAGHVFIADTGNNRVLDLPPGVVDPGLPTCQVAGILRAGQGGFSGQYDEEEVTVQSPVGLASIANPVIDNGTVSSPDFTSGTTAPIVVTATKAVQSVLTYWSFDANDQLDQTTHCT